jgi:hypothetical protein
MSEAKLKVQEALADDAMHKVNAFYRIYEGMDIMEELDQSHLVPTSQQNEDASSSESESGGKGTGQRFSPSPLSMKPQPKGMPASSWKDEDDNKDKDKS